MKIRLKKIIQLTVFSVIFLILQSCMTIETSMDINSDLSGSSMSKLSIAKNLLPEEQLKKEIEKAGIKKFELKKEESADNTTDVYNIKMEWKSEEELKKILLFVNTGATMSEFGTLLPNTSSNPQVASPETESQKKDESSKETVKIETKEENKNKVIKEPVQNVEGKIFVKDKNTVSVDMGIIKISKLSIKVKGKIVENSTQSGIVSASKDEITFYEGDKVSFKYKTENFMIPILIGISIAIVLGVIGAVFMQLKKRKNEEGEADDYSEEEIEEYKMSSESEVTENTEEKNTEESESESAEGEEKKEEGISNSPESGAEAESESESSVSAEENDDKEEVKGESI